MITVDDESEDDNDEETAQIPKRNRKTKSLIMDEEDEGEDEDVTTETMTKKQGTEDLIADDNMEDDNEDEEHDEDDMLDIYRPVSLATDEEVDDALLLVQSPPSYCNPLRGKKKVRHHRILADFGFCWFRNMYMQMITQVNNSNKDDLISDK